MFRVLKPWRPVLRRPQIHHARRHASTSLLDPSISGFVTKLAEKQPCYTAASENVRVMHQPSEFYQCLLVGTLSSPSIF